MLLWPYLDSNPPTKVVALEAIWATGPGPTLTSPPEMKVVTLEAVGTIIIRGHILYGKTFTNSHTIWWFVLQFLGKRSKTAE